MKLATAAIVLSAVLAAALAVPAGEAPEEQRDRGIVPPGVPSVPGVPGMAGMAPGDFSGPFRPMVDSMANLIGSAFAHTFGKGATLSAVSGATNAMNQEQGDLGPMPSAAAWNGAFKK